MVSSTRALRVKERQDNRSKRIRKRQTRRADRRAKFRQLYANFDYAMNALVGVKGEFREIVADVRRDFQSEHPVFKALNLPGVRGRIQKLVDDFPAAGKPQPGFKRKIDALTRSLERVRNTTGDKCARSISAMSKILAIMTSVNRIIQSPGFALFITVISGSSAAAATEAGTAGVGTEVVPVTTTASAVTVGGTLVALKAQLPVWIEEVREARFITRKSCKRFQKVTRTSRS